MKLNHHPAYHQRCKHFVYSQECISANYWSCVPS